MIRNFSAVQQLDGRMIIIFKWKEVSRNLLLVESVGIGGLSGEMLSGHGLEVRFILSGLIGGYASLIYFRLVHNTTAFTDLCGVHHAW